MKIEWLNEERTRALVTIGWFKKRQADVFLYCEGGHWYYVKHGRNGPWLPFLMQLSLDRARKKLRSAWQPVASVPVARVVRR